MTRGDKILLAVLVLLALAGIGWEMASLPVADHRQVEVLVDGRVVRTVALDGHQEEFRISGVGGYDVIQVDGSRVRVRDADCPDKLCIKMGWINRPPQQIVCVPNHVVVRVVGGLPADVDAIIR